MRHDAVIGPRFEVMRRFNSEDLETLRYAIGLRRAGIIDPRTDSLLGKILQNIGRIAVCQMKNQGKLTLKVRMDEDFDADATLYAVDACNSTDLTRNGPEIFKYILDRVKSRIANRVRDGDRLKRKAELVGMQGVKILTDFFGNIQQGAIQ